MTSKATTGDRPVVIFDRTYSGDVKAPGKARANLRAEFQNGETLDDVVLIVTELINNAVQYTRSRDTSLRLEISAPPIRISVIDRGPLTVPPQGREAEEHGRGVDLIQRLGGTYTRKPYAGRDGAGDQTTGQVCQVLLRSGLTLERRS